ncbi:MAG: hypothetical protein JNM81_13930 [Rhodospirillaceae bacterium]|nr:hypothetical protein [Rhodospirillaceae bacterium]
MTQSFASQLLSSRLVRNVLAIAGMLFTTFVIFRGVAAFNDVLKMYNSMPVVSPVAYTCPKGYVLVNIGKTDKQECIPAPYETKGVVAVGLYQTERKAPLVPEQKAPAASAAPAAVAPTNKPSAQQP